MILQLCAVPCTKLLCLVYSAAHCLPRLLLHAAARRLCTLAQASRNAGTATLSAVTRSAHESLEQLQLPLLHEARALVPPRRTHARIHAHSHAPLNTRTRAHTITKATQAHKAHPSLHPALQATSPFRSSLSLGP